MAVRRWLAAATSGRARLMTRERVLVAMSGGVDSSVAAALLVEQGRDVVGVWMRLHDGADVVQQHRPFVLLARRGRGRPARGRAAGHPVLRPQPRARVRRRRARAVLRRRTWRAARRVPAWTATRSSSSARCWDGRGTCTGATPSRPATTPASRRCPIPTARRAPLPSARPASTATRTRATSCYGLGQEQLAATRFPLGELTKPEVRAVARRHGLVTADKPDSQEICFVRDGDYRARAAPDAGHGPGTPGPLLDADGTVIGRARRRRGVHGRPAQRPRRRARRASLRGGHRRCRPTSSRWVGAKTSIATPSVGGGLVRRRRPRRHPSRRASASVTAPTPVAWPGPPSGRPTARAWRSSSTTGVGTRTRAGRRPLRRATSSSGADGSPQVPAEVTAAPGSGGVGLATHGDDRRCLRASPATTTAPMDAGSLPFLLRPRLRALGPRRVPSTPVSTSSCAASWAGTCHSCSSAPSSVPSPARPSARASATSCGSGTTPSCGHPHRRGWASASRS